MRVVRAFRQPVADRFEYRLVLVQTIILDPRRARPAELEGRQQRGVDEAAEGTEEMIAGGFEDRQMEAKVGGDQIAVAVLEALHVGVGGGDAVESWRPPARRRESCRGRLDDLAQDIEVGDQILGGHRLQVPGEHLGIEHVPVGLRAHPRAHLGARQDEALGGEHAIGLAQRRARHRETREHLDLGRQQGPRRIGAADDLAAEVVGEIGVDVVLDRRLSPPRRTRASVVSGPVSVKRARGLGRRSIRPRHGGSPRQRIWPRDRD